MARHTPFRASLAALAGLAGILSFDSALAFGPKPLTQPCEIAVARSALPERLREGASVYALVGNHYQKVVGGAGPFTCIVERNHSDSVVPQCMDEAGIDSVLPAIISRSEMSVAGMEFDAIEQANRERMANGTYRPAARPGVSYMMSDYNYTYVPSARQVMKVPPHVMFYAPGLTNAQVGGSLSGMIENIGTPFVFREGMHGYLITYTEHRANPNEVAQACRGQLGEAPPSFDPFPKG